MHGNRALAMGCLQLAGAAVQTQTNADWEAEIVTLILIVMVIWFVETIIARLVFHLQEVIGHLQLTVVWVSLCEHSCNVHRILD